MGTKTNIRWTDTTWNPVIGCSKVSPGCAHCYAEQLSMSPKMRPFGYTGLPWTPANAEQNVQLKPDRLSQPLHWRDPRRVFVNSMSDLFHELVPFEYIDQVFAIMALTPKHIYQILTKRPERMLEYMTWSDINSRKPPRDLVDRIGMAMNVVEGLPENMPRMVPGWADGGHGCLPNVWLGTSVENQHWADIRIPILLDTPAAVRFLSCEPLLGPLNLERALHLWRAEDGYGVHPGPHELHWVIVGGESGPNYRPMNLEWARSLRDQCQQASVAFFFKQTGGRRSETGKELDGVRWEQMPA